MQGCSKLLDPFQKCCLRYCALTSPCIRRAHGSKRVAGPQGSLALSLARYLKDEDFVVLHVHYRSAGGVGDPTTYARHNILCRLHNFFALPEDYAEQLPFLSITEGDKPLEPVQLLELR